MVTLDGWNWLAAGIAVVMMAMAEILHARRTSRIAILAFGPRCRTMLWFSGVVAFLRIFATASVAWGLTTLTLLPPMTHQSGEIKATDYRHLVMVLDVSRSMTIADAGPNGKQTRAERGADLIHSFFERVAAEKYKTTLIAFTTEAKVVAHDTTDREVIRHILTEIPLRHAFKPGETNIFAGLEEAARVAKPWPPGSAILMIVTDGDTVPATGMPKMPSSIGNNVVFIGVGNPNTPKSIGSHMSRQDASTLRQTATRLNGVYHDGNEKHLSTELISRIDERAAPNDKDHWTDREYALLTLGIGGLIMGMIPLILAIVGTGWHPGHRTVTT